MLAIDYCYCQRKNAKQRKISRCRCTFGCTYLKLLDAVVVGVSYVEVAVVIQCDAFGRVELPVPLSQRAEL